VYRDEPPLLKNNDSVSALTELSQLCLDTDDTDIENHTSSSPLLLDLK
jgi:hypothetical protein